MWLLFAILSSVFAALTFILAELGIDGVNSNFATGLSGFATTICKMCVQRCPYRQDEHRSHAYFRVCFSA